MESCGRKTATGSREKKIGGKLMAHAKNRTMEIGPRQEMLKTAYYNMLMLFLYKLR